MTANLPAYRYDLFIKAFEKKVTAAQAAIEALRAMELPYNVIRDAMEAARLPNEQSMHMEPRAIAIHLSATPTDSLEAMETLAQSIGQRLHAGGMHRDGDPATSHGGGAPCLWFAWQCASERTGGFQVRLFVSVPYDGMRDCEFVKTERRTVETQYEMKRIERPSYVAPAHLARVKSDSVGVARAAFPDDEIAF